MSSDDLRYRIDHDDRTGGQKMRNRKGRGPFKAPLYSDQVAKPWQRGGQKGGGGGPGPRARFEDDEGDVAMTDSNSQDASAQHRFKPYGRPNRRDERSDRRGRGVQRGRNRGGGGGGGRDGRDGGGRKTWFKISIPFGKKYEKDWLVKALQNVCTMPFTPIQYETEGNRAQFFIEDSTTANALKKVSRKITDREGYKVAVLMAPCSPPAFLESELKPEDLEHLKQCMGKRFDGSQQSLDLNNILIDPDLVSQNIEVALNRKMSMQAVIKIISENIPELLSLNLSNNKLYKLDDLAELVKKVPNLKSLNLSHNELRGERELDRLKGLKLVDLCLDKNPLCDNFKDQTAYIRSVYAQNKWVG